MQNNINKVRREKFKWIVVYGAGYWGLSYALIFYLLRVYVHEKAVSLVSIALLLVISVLMGAMWGALMYRSLIKK